MLYQILIEVTNIPGAKGNFNLYEYDKEAKEVVIEEIVIPYLKKEEFQFNGYFLKPTNVIRISVKTTNAPVKSIVDRENASNPPGFLIFTTREQIVQDSKHTFDVTKEIFAEAKAILSTEDKITNSQEAGKEEIDRSKVFIVHGHDEVVKLSVARFLEKMGLTPIILHEQASQGKTIIEKIEEHSNVGFGIVLYTPCDLGKSKDSELLQPRARQNVVFEHGYLMAKIGRNNVCALVKDDVEKPNDISGIVYINYDSNWHMDLLKELKTSGYEVNANLLL
ncbi:TIR domain-containing protein [Bacillus infantis]|uniref:TIR domain-containing protein n=1 Tax=Bacillus infantis TaxID=324767 RepID=UPI003CED7698